jgi:hypothetical protein
MVNTPELCLPSAGSDEWMGCVIASALELLYFDSYYRCCGIFAQNKNCGARETAITGEQLRNNIRF